MTEEISLTEYYNDLAEKYKINKRSAIENLLLAGKILAEARTNLSTMQFTEWLKDYRVSESLRTAQRLLSIHADFGHLLDHKEKLNTIDSLGMTSLLELKKLPERFRKDIEVIYNDGDEEKHIIKSVIDEDKLSDFLDTTVEIEGKPIKIKELPASELNKQIKIAQGVFEPEDFGDRNDDYVEATVSEEEPIKPITKTSINEVKDILINNLELFSQLFSLIDKIDDVSISESSDNDLSVLKDNTKKFLSMFEGIYLKVKYLDDKIN